MQATMPSQQNFFYLFKLITVACSKLSMGKSEQPLQHASHGLTDWRRSTMMCAGHELDFRPSGFASKRVHASLDTSVRLCQRAPCHSGARSFHQASVESAVHWLAVCKRGEASGMMHAQ